MPVQLQVSQVIETKLTTIVDLPGIDESIDKDFLLSRLEQSGKRRKELFESEL